MILNKYFRKKKKSDLPTKEDFYRFKIIALVHTILWLGAVGLLWYYWKILPWYKYVSVPILGFTTPTPSAIFESYEKYVERWKDITGYEKKRTD